MASWSCPSKELSLMSGAEADSSNGTWRACRLDTPKMHGAMLVGGVECKAMGRVTKTRHPSCHTPNVHKARFDQQVTVRTSMGENEQRCTWFLKHVQSCWVPRCTSAIPTQRSAKQLLLVVCHAGVNMMRVTQNTTRIIDKTPLARSLASF